MDGNFVYNLYLWRNFMGDSVDSQLYNAQRKLQLLMLKAYDNVFSRNPNFINYVNKVPFSTDIGAHEGGTVTFVLRKADGDIYYGRATGGHSLNTLTEALEQAMGAFVTAQAGVDSVNELLKDA